MVQTTEHQKTLRVLIIDDSEMDAELALFELEKAGYEVDSVRVQTAPDLRAVLDQKRFDCIICDHKMPGFSSREALEIVKSKLNDNVPFLIVSGIIGEEIAVDAMRAGAHDYIMKNNLLRLVPAIEREMREASIRRQNRESLERLIESERRFRSMAEAAPIMIWVCDDRMRCTFINKRLLDFLGGGPGNGLCPLLWEARVHPEDRDRVSESFRSAFEAREEFSIEYRMRRKDGEWRTLLDSAVPRANGNGNFEGYIGSSVDLTDQIRARQEAEQANLAKSRFLANMSHEIRTPLGAILGFADLLREEELNREEREHYLDIIIRNGSELLRIIGDILDLSKIEAGKIAVEISTFRLQELVSEVISLLDIKAKEKGLELTATIVPSAPMWLESDRTRLRQILINIIGNAIKFTSEGRVSVSVFGALGAERRMDAVKFVVEDTGPGIPPNKRAELFQPFSQVDDSTTRAFGGTGLGLVLSRHMARSLGGDVEIVDTEAGHGTRFEVTVAANALVQTTGDGRITNSSSRSCSQSFMRS